MEKKLYQFGIVVKEPTFRTDLVEAQNHVPTYVLRRYIPQSRISFAFEKA